MSVPGVPARTHGKPARRPSRGSPTSSYIVGSFQVKIPVSTRDGDAAGRGNHLGHPEGAAGGDAKDQRWYPVLVRYIGQIAGRVDGLGGNAPAIPPSLGGYRPPRKPIGRPCEEDIEEFTGKVCEVVFNCFGDFVGFVMDDCCEHRTFESRKREIGDLALRALKERLTLIVVTAGKDHKIVRLVVKG